MRKWIVGFILLFAVINCVSLDMSAQMGIGIKVPSTTVFVSNQLDYNTIFELGASLQALSNGVISLSALGKIYFATIGSEIVLEPFLGAGVGISFYNSGLFFSPFVLAGTDAPIPNTPFTAFLELGLGLTFNTLGIGLVPGGELGIRLDF